MMNAGLEISLLDVTTSRAALIQNAINILNGPGDLRSKFQRVEQEVRPILAKEADKWKTCSLCSDKKKNE